MVLTNIVGRSINTLVDGDERSKREECTLLKMILGSARARITNKEKRKILET